MLGKTLHEVDDRRKVAMIDEDVVGEIEIPQKSDSAKEIVAEKEPIVGLGLYHVPDASKARMLGEPLERGANVG